MSYEVQRAVGRAIIGKKPGVSAALRKAIMMNMAIRANDDGTGIYASKLRIAMWLEAEERSVRRAVSTLEADSLLVDTGEHVNENGSVTRNYKINLGALEKLPRTEDTFSEKRTAERSRKKKGADQASAPKSGAKADRSSAPGADVLSAAADRSSANLPERDSLPSKEGRESHMSDANASNVSAKKNGNGSATSDGFALTPNARDPNAPKRETGRRAPKVGEVSATRAFWARLKDSGLLHETAKGRCKPNRIDEQLAPILQTYGDVLVTKVVGSYYKREKKTEGGIRAAGLQTICEDGRLVDWCEDAKKRTDASANGNGITIQEAMKRLEAAGWRSVWGDAADPIYDAAREAIASAKRGGDSRKVANG